MLAGLAIGARGHADALGALGIAEDLVRALIDPAAVFIPLAFGLDTEAALAALAILAAIHTLAALRLEVAAARAAIAVDGVAIIAFLIALKEAVAADGLSQARVEP